MKPMGWRAFQRRRNLLIHARDLSVCLAAISLWALAIWAATL